jgi:ATP-binding cassette subfamily F protein uup
VKALSGGERNRLLLARLFARAANVLILDEPTNDLDIETLELLEELISGFDGTVLLVTHDRAFLDNVVTSTLAFEGDGRVREYVGGWEDYLRASGNGKAPAPETGGEPGGQENRARASSRGAVAPQDAVPPGAGAGRPGRRKKTFNEEREYAALPGRIEALEDEQRRLQAEAAGPDFYQASAERIHEVLTRIDVLQAELEQALARWVELEEIGR